MCVLLLLLSPPTAGVVYVSPSGTDSGACGTTPGTACLSISWALVRCAALGDYGVQLSDDTHTASGSCMVTVSVNTVVSPVSIFAVNQARISCPTATHGWLVTGNTTLTLSNVVLTNYALVDQFLNSTARPAVLRVQDGSKVLLQSVGVVNNTRVLQQCVIDATATARLNTTTMDTALVIVDVTSRLDAVVGCTFAFNFVLCSNTSTSSGPAVRANGAALAVYSAQPLLQLINSTFTGNQLASPLLGAGAALVFQPSSAPAVPSEVTLSLLNCTFSANTVGRAAAAVLAQLSALPLAPNGTTVRLTMQQCAFTDNLVLLPPAAGGATVPAASVDAGTGGALGLYWSRSVANATAVATAGALNVSLQLSQCRFVGGGVVQHAGGPVQAGNTLGGGAVAVALQGPLPPGSGLQVVAQQTVWSRHTVMQLRPDGAGPDALAGGAVLISVSSGGNTSAVGGGGGSGSGDGNGLDSGVNVTLTDVTLTDNSVQSLAALAGAVLRGGALDIATEMGPTAAADATTAAAHGAQAYTVRLQRVTMRGNRVQSASASSTAAAVVGGAVSVQVQPPPQQQQQQQSVSAGPFTAPSSFTMQVAESVFVNNAVSGAGAVGGGALRVRATAQPAGTPQTLAVNVSDSVLADNAALVPLQAALAQGGALWADLRLQPVPSAPQTGIQAIVGLSRCNLTANRVTVAGVVAPPAPNAVQSVVAGGGAVLSVQWEPIDTGTATAAPPPTGCTLQTVLDRCVVAGNQVAVSMAPGPSSPVLAGGALLQMTLARAVQLASASQATVLLQGNIWCNNSVVLSAAQTAPSVSGGGALAVRWSLPTGVVHATPGTPLLACSVVDGQSAYWTNTVSATGTASGPPMLLGGAVWLESVGLSPDTSSPTFHCPVLVQRATVQHNTLVGGNVGGGNAPTLLGAGVMLLPAGVLPPNPLNLFLTPSALGLALVGAARIQDSLLDSNVLASGTPATGGVTAVAAALVCGLLQCSVERTVVRNHTSATALAGALLASYTLTLTGAMFFGNAVGPYAGAGAVYAGVALSDSGSLFAGNSGSGGGYSVCGSGAVLVAAAGAVPVIVPLSGVTIGLYNGSRSNFTDNVCVQSSSSSCMGGAVVSTLVQLWDCAFVGNAVPVAATPDCGGALSINPQSAALQPLSASVILNTLLSNNAAPQCGGGAVVAIGASLRLSNSVLSNNTGLTGAVAVAQMPQLLVHQTTFLRNRGSLAGAVASSTPGPRQIEVDRAQFVENQSGGSGGALSVGIPSPLGAWLVGSITFVSVSVCTFQGNQAAVQGGAIALQGAGNTLVLYDVTFRANTAAYGGALFTFPDTVLQVIPLSVLMQNSAQVSGGAAYLLGDTDPVGALPLHLLNNTAPISPGIVYPLSHFAVSVLGQPCYATSVPSPLVDGSNSSSSFTPASANSTDGFTVMSGCPVLLTVSLIDQAGQVVGVLPPALPTLPLSFSASSSCFAALPLTMLTASPVACNLSISGPFGSAFWFQISSGTQLSSSRVTGRIGPRCGVGFVAPAATAQQPCARCDACAQGTYSLNSSTSCLQCPPLTALCREAFVWARAGRWGWVPSATSRGNLSATLAAVPGLEAVVSMEACASGTCLEACTAVDGAVDTNQCHSSYSVRCYSGNATTAEAGLVGDYCETINLCSPGRAGFLCGRCADGYAFWNDACIDCSQPRPGLVVVMVLINWAMVLVLYMLLASGQNALAKTLLYFVQVTFSVMSSNSPLQVLSRIVNISPTVGSLCPHDRDIYLSFTDRMLYPILSLFQLFISFLILLGIAFVRRRCCHRDGPRGDGASDGAYSSVSADTPWAGDKRPDDIRAAPLSEALLTPDGSSRLDVAVARASRSLAAHPAAAPPLVDSQRWLWRPLQALLLGTYTPLALVVAGILSCRPVGGRALFVLTAAPAYACAGPTYQLYFTVALILLVVYVVGLPLVLLVLLVAWRARLDEPSLQRTFGYVYECYRPGRRFWEVVVLTRRALMIALGAVFDPATRLFLLAAASLLILMVQMFARPHITALENGTELISLALLTFIAAAEASALALQAAFNVAVLETVAFAVGLLVIVLALLYRSRATLGALWQRLLSIGGRLRGRCCGPRPTGIAEQRRVLAQPLLSDPGVHAL